MPHVREIVPFFIAATHSERERTRSRQRDDPNLAKTLSFSVRASAPRARLLSSESSKPLLSLPAMQSSRGGLPFGRASPQAPVRPSFRQSRAHCGVLRIFLRWQLRVTLLHDFMARSAPSRYCSLRCAPPLTVLPPPMERSLSISRREIVATAEKSTPAGTTPSAIARDRKTVQ